MMVHSALEEEVTAFLERDYYERIIVKRGSRNGTKPREVKVGGGDIEIRMPQVRDAEEPLNIVNLES